MRELLAHQKFVIPASASQSAPTNRMKVLVVDEHPLVCEVHAAIVRSTLPDAEILSALSLVQALAIAGDQDVRLVLLDLALPGCMGIDAFVRFREKCPDPRVIVVSADDSPDLIQAALAAGAAGYLLKTLRPNVMAAAVRLVS